MDDLRFNTATRITVGPIMGTDGITPVTALTHANEHLTLIANSAGVPALVLDTAPTASGGNNDLVHITGDDAGYFDLELTAADTNYYGPAKLALTNAAAHIPVFHDFNIVSQAYYDAKYGTGNFPADLKAILGTALTETAGYLAAGFKKFFNVAAPTGTVNSIPDAVAGAANGIAIVGSVMGKSPATLAAADVTGNLPANLTAILGTALTETAGYLAAGFKKFFNIPAPVSTMDVINTVSTLTGHTPQTGDTYALANGANGFAALKTDTGAIANICNNTRVTATVPEELQIPAAASNTQAVHLLLYDEVGNMEAPDSVPTVALANVAGTDRSARLDSTNMTLVATGHYKVIYTNTAGDAREQLLWTFSVVEGGQTRVFMRQTQLVDVVAADFTADDRSKLNTLAGDYTTVRAAKLDNLDAAVSTRSSHSAANVATLILATPANLLATSPAGHVTYANAAPPSAAAIRAEMDANSTQLAAILEDTGTTIPAAISGLSTFDPATDKVDLVDAPNSQAVAALQGGLATEATVAGIDAQTSQLVFVDGKVEANAAFTLGEEQITAMAEEITAQMPAPVVIPLVEGRATAVELVRRRDINLKRGDSYTLAFSLGRDCTDWEGWFAGKRTVTQSTYDMPERQVTWVDRDAGTGTVELSKSDTATVGKVVAELVLLRGEERSTPEEYHFDIRDRFVSRGDPVPGP